MRVAHYTPPHLIWYILVHVRAGQRRNVDGIGYKHAIQLRICVLNMLQKIQSEFRNRKSCWTCVVIKKTLLGISWKFSKLYNAKFVYDQWMTNGGKTTCKYYYSNFKIHHFMNIEINWKILYHKIIKNNWYSWEPVFC